MLVLAGARRGAYAKYGSLKFRVLEIDPSPPALAFLPRHQSRGARSTVGDGRGVSGSSGGGPAAGPGGRRDHRRKTILTTPPAVAKTKPNTPAKSGPNQS